MNLPGNYWPTDLTLAEEVSGRRGKVVAYDEARQLWTIKMIEGTVSQLVEIAADYLYKYSRLSNAAHARRHKAPEQNVTDMMNMCALPLTEAHYLSESSYQGS